MVTVHSGYRQETKGELFRLERRAGKPKSWAVHARPPSAGNGSGKGKGPESGKQETC